MHRYSNLKNEAKEGGRWLLIPLLLYIFSFVLVIVVNSYVREASQAETSLLFH